MKLRPKCINYGCSNLCTHSGKRYRPHCDPCHRANYKGESYLPYGVTPFKKGVCSNTDGHLGWKCYIDWERARAEGISIKTVIDHINGNLFDNTHENADELCEPCHSEKSKRSGDYKYQNKY